MVLSKWETCSGWPGNGFGDRGRVEAEGPVAASRRGTEAEICLGQTKPKVLVDMQGLSPEAAGYLLSPAYLSQVAWEPGKLPAHLPMPWTPFPIFQGTPSRLCTWKSGPLVTEERGKWDPEALLKFSNCGALIFTLILTPGLKADV